MKIYGLLIVKNEAEVLQRCIDSYSKALDGFYILDTGSADINYLKKINSEKNVATFFHDFENFQFDVARNELISKVENIVSLDDSTYFMMIDADDLHDGSQLPLLTKDVYSVQYETSPRFLMKAFRLWKAKLKLRYQDAVHEYLKWDAGAEVGSLETKIYHKPLPTKVKDPERNYKLLRKEMPTLRQLFYMGNELMDLNRPKEAIIYWKHYIDRANFEGAKFADELMCCYWRLARYTNNKDDALDIAKEGLQKFPRCAELKGEISYRQGDEFIKDIEWFDHLFGERNFYLQTPMKK